jgi:hypothetical protein
MALPGEIGWIGKHCTEHPYLVLDTKIMQSAAGYFLGTQCATCAMTDPSPHSRETGYYESKRDLRRAFLDGTIQWRDAGFHPGPMDTWAIAEALKE